MHTKAERWHLIDALRGLALLNMLGMHFLYDWNVVFGREPRWHLRPEVHLWQQYICWSFILIAGLAFHWGRHRNLRRGLLLNLLGFLINSHVLKNHYSFSEFGMTTWSSEGKDRLYNLFISESVCLLQQVPNILYVV